MNEKGYSIEVLQDYFSQMANITNDVFESNLLDGYFFGTLTGEQIQLMKKHIAENLTFAKEFEAQRILKSLRASRNVDNVEIVRKDTKQSLLPKLFYNEITAEELILLTKLAITSKEIAQTILFEKKLIENNFYSERAIA